MPRNMKSAEERYFSTEVLWKGSIHMRRVGKRGASTVMVSLPCMEERTWSEFSRQPYVWKVA